MAFQPGQNPNHPVRGSAIRVEPIREKAALRRIKKLLQDRPRDLCLFTLGINTALRANELLSLRVDQVSQLQPGDSLMVHQSKTGQYRSITLNRSGVTAIQTWLAAGGQNGEFLFAGQRGVLTVPTVSTQVKTWCRHAGLRGNYGSHSLRKTWGYWQRVERGTAIPLLMEAFGHATQQQTLAYLGIQAEEIAQIYDLEL